MDEEDIDIKDRDVLHYPRNRNILLDSSGLIFTPARAVKRVKIEQLPDDESHELDHQLDTIYQPGSSLQEPSHQDTPGSYNIEIKQELREYEYLSDCNDIHKADNSDQADNIDRSDNNIDQTGSFIKPENANSDLSDNIDGSETANHSDINGSDNLDQVSDIKLVNSDIISSHTSDINIISNDTEYQLPNNGDSLCQNGCFCDICEIKFETPNALDYHKTSVHSFLVAVSRNVARKSTSKSYIRKTEVFKRAVAKKSTGGKFNSRFCNHCHMTFSDNTSLIKHIYELIPTKQFNCNNCNLKFTTQNELTMHSIEHKELPNPKLVKVTKHQSVNNPAVDKTKLSKANCFAVNKNDDKFKCTLCSEIFDNYNNCKKHRDRVHPATKNLTIFTKLTAKKRKDEVIDDKNVDNSVMIPKSTLFKCKTCNLHFLSGFTAVLHRACNIVKDFWLCGICNRKFIKEDQNLHKKQHEVNTRFRVHLIVSDLYHRILCRCPHCSLHFEEKQFKPHLKYCTKITKEMCSTCKILLPKSRLAEHTRKHVYFHFQPADFFILNYITEKHKRKSNDDLNETAPKIRKLNDEEFGNKVVIYYCKNCKCCVSSKKPIIRESHATKRCLKNNAKICGECGLYFTSKAILSHSQYHIGRSITIRDIKMIDIVTMQVITPVIPNYPQCGKCKINFFSMEAKDDHICGEDYETCEFCGDRYHNFVYDIHRLFHDEYTPETNNANKENKKTNSFKLFKSHTIKKSYPERKIIDIDTSKFESLKGKWFVYLFNCKICDINTDSYDDCVEHSQRHIAQRLMTEQSIKCNICHLKFDETLWSKHADFHGHAKINRNNFRLLTFDPRNLLTETWFQMFEGYSENAISRLIDDSVYRTERSVIMELVKPGRSEYTLYTCANCRICFEQDAISRHVADKCRVSANVCQVCEIAFDDILNLQQHKDLHEKGMDKSEFRIVSFNKLIEQSVVNKTRLNNDKNKPYTVYKCANCDVCVTLRHSIMRHYCGRNTHKFCKICNQKFSYQSIPKHNRKHKTDPKFKAVNINIEIFQPRRHTPYPRKHTKLPYKMPIKLNKFNMQRPSKLMDHKVPVCRDLKGRIMLYKCSECQVCFMLHPSAENHRCDSVKTKFYCKICREKFGSNTTPSHKARHKLNPSCKADNFIINLFKPRTKTTAAIFTIKPQDIKVKAIKKVTIKKPLVKPLGYKTTLRFKHSNVTLFGLNEINQNKKKYIRYHCVRCNLTMLRASVRSHKCLETVNKKKYHCNICNQIIVNSRKAEHIKKHKDFPDFISENIQIIKFKSQGFEQDEIEDKDSPNKEEIDSRNKEENVLENHSKKYKVLKCVECNMSRDIKFYENSHRCVYDPRRKLHCKICDLIILKSYKTKHLAKHNDPNFRKDNIEIIPYKSNQSVTEKRSFEDSNENNDDRVDESMDVDFNQDYEQHVAEQQKTNPNLTQYKHVQYECTLCKRNLLDMRNVRNHNCSLGTKERNVDFYCSLCNCFYPTQLKQKHKLRHDSEPAYHARNIFIYLFCNKNDDDETMDVDDNVKSINCQQIEIYKKYKYIQYECTRCKGNLLEKQSMRRHNCIHRSSLTYRKFNYFKTFFCDICKRLYSLGNRSAHEIRHKSYPDYNSDTIQVVPFRNSDDEFDSESDSDDGPPVDDQENDFQASIVGQENDLQASKDGRENYLQASKDGQENDLQASIVSQENDLQASKDGQGNDLQASKDGQGNDLQASIDDQENDLQASIGGQEIKGERKLKYVQYECTICKVNLSRSDVIKDHNCTSMKFKNFYKTFYCDICKLSYSLKIKSSHRLRHKTRPDYNPDTIKVVPFCNKKDIKSIDGDGDDNADLASSIDDQETEHQSVDDQEVGLQASIDGQERENICGKKYKTIQYQCTICKASTLRMKIVQDHNSTLKLVQEHNCTKCGLWTDNTFFCDICGLSYPIECESSHRLRHVTRPDYKPETIRSVPLCNNETKDDDDPVDPSVDTDDQETLTDKVIDKVETMDTNRKYIQYECVICKINITNVCHIEELLRHNCVYGRMCLNVIPTFFCDICDRRYRIWSTSKRRSTETLHKLEHEKFKDYNADNIVAIPFDPLATTTKKGLNVTFYDGEKTNGDLVLRLYRCHCCRVYHFISMKPVDSNPDCSYARIYNIKFEGFVVLPLKKNRPDL